MSDAAILVAETVSKDVVYSAECFNEPSQYSPDSQTKLVVEYSILALEAKYQAPGADTREIKKYTDASLDIIVGCCAVGSFVCPPAAPVLAAVAAVGKAIQFFMSLIPDNRPTPEMVAFKKLEKAIHKLQDLMVAHFADMQSFISEHNFNVNVTTPASTLLRFLRNCLEHSDEMDVENFERAYQKNAPLSMIYSMMNLLENPSTNPLLMAMSAEKVMTRATFDKWKKIIQGIFGQYVFIEAFAYGLLNKSDFAWNRMEKEWKKLEKLFEQWENELSAGNEVYWKDFKEFLELTLSKDEHLDKTWIVRDKLKTYLTRDSFFVLDFVARANSMGEFGYHCDSEKEQLLSVTGKGGVRFVVYRSLTAHKSSKEDFEAIKSDVSNRFNDNVVWNGSVDGYIKKEFVEKKFKGFVGVWTNGMGGCHAVNTPPDNKTKYDDQGPGSFRVSHNITMRSKRSTCLVAALP